jgi:hypothetical protein
VGHVLPGGILAHGSYFAFAPGTVIPSVTVYLRGFRTICHEMIWVRDFGKGMVGGSDWTGMLEPDGTYSWKDLGGNTHLSPAFKYSSGSDPVLEFQARQNEEYQAQQARLQWQTEEEKIPWSSRQNVHRPWLTSGSNSKGGTK